MADRPILMSGPLVVATLAGRKTQTRRVVKPWPEFIGGHGEEHDLSCWGWPCPSGAWVVLDREAPPYHGPSYSESGGVFAAACPYGGPGDRLWVRETWMRSEQRFSDGAQSRNTAYRADLAHGAHWDDGERHFMMHGRAEKEAFLPADYRGARWRPSIHMPRWASRLTLVVDAVRVERVQAISEDDARAEGIGQGPDGWWNGSAHRIKGTPKAYPTAVQAFADLWEAINGKRPGCTWADNPFVWCISYHEET